MYLLLSLINKKYIIYIRLREFRDNFFYNFTSKNDFIIFKNQTYNMPYVTIKFIPQPILKKLIHEYYKSGKLIDEGHHKCWIKLVVTNKVWD